MDLKDLMEYGDKYELENGEICVYIRENIDEGQLQSCVLKLVNILTGEEHNLSEYTDKLKHCRDSKLDVVRRD